MKKISMKVLSAILASVMLICSAPLAGLAGIDIGSLFTVSAAKISSYEVGDIIEFGWYPQSEVTDSSIISALNTAGGEWISYGYYSGTQYGNLGSLYDGQMKAGDFMRYKDVIYGSDKYRGVVFDIYRPGVTGKKTDDYHSSDKRQWSNGYTYGNVYWFKYEPIEWRVLDPDTGMVMAETILDSQAYNNYTLKYGTDGDGVEAFWGDSSRTYYANDYVNSSIREWLNYDFYNTAFSTAQQGIIKYTRLDNSASREEDSEYDSAATNDKIYLLSWDDMLNTSYGFSSDYKKYDGARRTQGSDYAKCQGLWVFRSDGHSYDGVSEWLLRSAFNTSNRIRYVCTYGHVDDYTWTHYTDCGIRPALNFNPSSQIFQSDVKDTGSYSGEVPVHKHSYTSTITTPATCTAKGVKTFTCSCGYSYTESIPAKGHDLSAWLIYQESTCTERGIRYKGCYTCEEVIEAEYIPLKDHTESDWIRDSYPTCTERGYAHKECTVCGIVTDTGYYEMTGHTEGNWEITKAATCSAKGTRVKKCTVCKAVIKSEDIAMTSHSAGNWEITQKATCTKNGTKVKKCVNCGITVDTEVISATGHSYAVVSDVAPTCTKAGSKSYKCSSCQYTYTETIPATGHTDGKWEIIKEPTCTETGLKKGKCSACGQVLDSAVIPAKGHTPGEWQTVTNATCTADGSKVKKCTVCKAVVENESIPATGHTDGSWEIIKAPTCTEAGLKKGKCSVCKQYLESVTIPATGHKESDWICDKLPTCTEKGDAHKECTVCGAITLYGKYDPTGHKAGNWETVIEPTTETEGKKVKKCTACGTTLEEEVIAKIPKEAVKDDSLIKTPSRTSVNYGDALILHVDASKIPEGGYVEWTKSNDNFEARYVDETHVSCKIEPDNDGSTVFVATVYDAQGNPVLTDEVTMKANASLFRMIIGLFKVLFGLAKTYPSAIRF